MTIEQVLLLMFFILLPLINWFLRRVERGAETEAPAPRPLPESRRRRQESPVLRAAAPEATAERLKIPPTATPPAAVWRDEVRRRLLPKTKADLRHAIILMTILGPCRAVEPSDERRTL